MERVEDRDDETIKYYPVRRRNCFLTKSGSHTPPNPNIISCKELFSRVLNSNETLTVFSRWNVRPFSYSTAPCLQRYFAICIGPPLVSFEDCWYYYLFECYLSHLLTIYSYYLYTQQECSCMTEIRLTHAHWFFKGRKVLSSYCFRIKIN